jgi:3-oxoadipate enol-lactonase
MRHGETRAADGTRLAWRHWGEAGAPRVALVHSLALHGGMWEGVAEALAGRASLLALDCRGHGASGRAPGPYTTELFADDLAAVLDGVGWDRAVVAGCSMGGCVAQHFAARYPARTAGLALFDTTAWYGPDAPAAWADRAAKARAGGMRSLAGFQATRWFTAGFDPAVLKQWLDAFAENDIACYAESCAMLGGADLRPLLPRIAAPTAVMVGAEDEATTPAMARAIADAVPGATLEIVARAKHLLPIERPEAAARAIAALLEPRA